MNFLSIFRAGRFWPTTQLAFGAELKQNINALTRNTFMAVL